MKRNKQERKLKQLFEQNEILNDCSKYPELLSGGLGTCAFVAQGSSLLRVPWGEEIDLHSTVIRFGHMPLRGFESFTGRKTDALFGRGSIQTKYAGDYSEVRYLFNADRSGHQFARREKALIQIQGFGGFKQMPQEADLKNGLRFCAGDDRIPLLLYHFMTTPIAGKPRGPSSGFTSALQIILSGLCEKVDIYGLSPNCGGYYHDRKITMKLHHSCELESWVLHYIMRNYYESFHTCVHI